MLNNLFIIIIILILILYLSIPKTQKNKKKYTVGIFLIFTIILLITKILFLIKKNNIRDINIIPGSQY